MFKFILFSALISVCNSWCVHNSSLSSVSCNNVEFTHIQYLYYNNYFGNKDKHEKLFVTGCNLTTVNASSVPAPNLYHLKLECGVRKLTSDGFSNLCLLEELDLSKNHISEIPENFFKNLTKLRKLNLSFNQLEILRNFSFKYLTNLRDLNLGNNKIRSIELGVLNQFPDIIRLDLQHNEILQPIKWYPFFFRFNINNTLQELDLSFNQIKFKYYNFSKLRKLEKLILKSNHLHDRFGELTNKSFKENESLKYLDISSMDLSTFEEGMFDKNLKLAYLIASNNKFTNLPFFHNTNELVYLNLTRNRITSVSQHLYNFKKLKIIDLSYNELRSFSFEIFKLDTLVEVHIKGNKLINLDPPLLKHNALKLMDVRNNMIVAIDKNFYSKMNSLQSLEITGNPWDCACLNDLMKWMSDRHIDFTRDECFDGKRSICVAFGTMDCNHVLEDDFQKYYDTFFGPDLWSF